MGVRECSQRQSGVLVRLEASCFTISHPSIHAVKRDISVDVKCSDCVTVILKLDLERAEISQKNYKHFLRNVG